MREKDERFLTVAQWAEVYRADLVEDGFDPDEQKSFAELYGYGDKELGMLDKMGVTDRQNLNRVVAAFIVDKARCPDFSPIIFGMQLIANSGLTAPEVAGILGEAVARLAVTDHDDPLERMFDA